MAVKAGDFLLVNFTLKVKESGETVDTTYDAVAKDTHLHREDSTYGPRFIILGEGWLPKGLEDSLVGADIGKQTTVELPPDKGFGTRDPDKMRLVPLRRFREQGIPSPGAQIELDGRPATVRAVGAGRVQVDYNHPLAGRPLICRNFSQTSTQSHSGRCSREEHPKPRWKRRQKPRPLK